MENKINIPSHLLMGLAASVIAFVFMLSVMLPVETEAQEESVMNFTVANVAPSVGSVTCDTESLQEATDYYAWCFATITDTNGYQDVALCNGTFFRTSVGMAGAANENNRYSNSSCYLYGGSGNTVNCNCSFRMKYYADGNVEWTGNLTARDAASSGRNAGTKSITSITAIDLTTNKVQWGTLQVSTTTTFNTANYTKANNTGNVNESVQIAAAAAQMTCTPSPANIDVGNIKAWIQTGAYAAGGQALTTGQVDVTGGWIKNRQHGAPATVENRTIYWAINVPTGVNGTCTITVNQYAVIGV